jgi:peptidoglycan/xylan/chitin deacetylase (PgdA/CDA1 family)
LVPTIDARAGTGPREWLRSGDWRLFVRPAAVDGGGRELARFTTADGNGFIAYSAADLRRVCVPFDLDEAFNSYVSETWSAGTVQRKLSTRQLSVFYSLKKFIPRRAQLIGRRLLIRWQGLPEFPAWPLDRSVARLLRFYARCVLAAAGRTEAPFRWFWPDGFRAALILTHDVESREGLRMAVELADLEEERGLRSSFNIVALGYEIDDGIVRELRERGFELGVHGVRHDRSMFSSRSAFEAQRAAVSSAAAQLGATGFRSPATHRVFEWLGELPLSYDCSIPHSDPFEPQPGGCCTLWPFFIGSLVELPYTMPQDHTLFTLLGHRSPDLWLRQVESIEAEHGLAQCVSHPDPGYLGDPAKRALYAEFLDRVATRAGLWKTLPGRVASWWRTRDAEVIAPGPHECGTMRMDEEGADVAFEPPAPG